MMVFAHLLSSLSIAAPGTFLMRLESRTTQGDWLRARFTFPSMALSESDHEDVGYSLALLARPIHEHYVVASEG